MLKILFCGGGSVGHLAPSLAVWEAFVQKRPNAKALFLCSFRKGDRLFLSERKLPFRRIIAPKIQCSCTLLLFPVLFPLACLQALSTLLSFKPNIIFAKGGYVSVPVSLMGWLFRIPIVIHESDSALGRSNRLLLRFAKVLCIGSPQRELLNGDGLNPRVEVIATGNPIRADLLNGSVDGGKRVTGFSGKRPVLMVIGGSQGAKTLNDILSASIEDMIDHYDIIHISGRGKSGAAKSHSRYFQKEFVYDDLPELYAIADIVVSRAGAGSIAELAACSKTTILVPLPDLAHNHQEENALFLEKAGAAVVLRQKELQEKFLPTIQKLMGDDALRADVSQKIHSFAAPEAAETIANVLIDRAKQYNSNNTSGGVREPRSWRTTQGSTFGERWAFSEFNLSLSKVFFLFERQPKRKKKAPKDYSGTMKLLFLFTQRKTSVYSSRL